MESPAINNRLHRSGAIDFNVAYNIRQAEVLREEKSIAKKLYEVESNGRSHDILSVCEGEPLYYAPKGKGARHNVALSGRNPLALLSSVNGLKCQNNTTLRDEGAHGFFKDLDHNSSEFDKLQACEKLRNAVFSEIKYSGVAVTNWNYDRIGKQGDLFVATRGGLNTIYVDDNVEAGDTLVVDLPFNEEWDGPPASNSDSTAAAAYGFVQWQPKKGVPSRKKTLVVRSLPSVKEGGGIGPAHAQYLRKSFARRGQIVGQCVRSAKKGERCDVVLAANAIGMWTSKHNAYDYFEAAIANL